MKRSIPFLALVPLLALVPASAGAAAPAAAVLAAQVPDGAVAVAELRPASLQTFRTVFDANPALRTDLATFLGRTVGIDLTTVEAAVVYSSKLAPEPTFAAYLRFARPGKLHGTKVGAFQGTDLIKVGDLVAASVPGGLIVGNLDEVQRGIAVALKHAPALGDKSPLFAPLADRAPDFIVAVDPAGTPPEVAAIAQQYGARVVTLLFRSSNQVALEVSGDGARLATARDFLIAAANMGLAQLKANMDKAAAGDDVLEGATAIVGYHQAAQAWKELTPKLTGNKLVSQYQLPDAKTMASAPAIVGVLAAIAIPSFMKYVRRSKTVEATMNLRKLADAAVARANGKKKPRLVASTDWTPAAPCCPQTKGMCQPDAQAWSAPAWKALDFSIAEPHYYQYRIVTSGKGAKQTMAIEARGDLDCDGKFSLYQRTISIGADGNAATGPLMSKDEIE
jgi:type IV pilus assembly protein PilA